MNVSLFLEIKNEYTEHLVDTITPFIYEGLNSIYKEAVKIAEQTNCNDKILLIFQKLLQSVSSWNQMRIDEETMRIKVASNTSEYLDDLIKAVIKSNIILLAYSNTISNIIGQTFYNNMTTSFFIHRCYTECAKDAHNNPYLFYHDINPMDLKRNQIIIQQNIQAAIVRAIRKILPISMILKEYLINSVNIINEPPKIELLGMPESKNQEVKPKSEKENKIDPKLEKEVMNIIRSENTKSDKQKVKAIMNIDKIITSIEPNKINDLSIKNNSLKENLSHFKSELIVNPHLVDNKHEVNNSLNKNLAESDKKVINIDFDDEETIHTNKEHITQTTMSNKLNNKYLNGNVPLTSERIDPNNINLIEDYGHQTGGKNKNKSKKSKK